jgi:hypothetical protein
MFERTPMTTISQVEPEHQARMGTQHKWRNPFWKKKIITFIRCIGVSIATAQNTAISRSVCTLGARRPTKSTKFSVSGLLFHIFNGLKRKRLPRIHSDRRFNRLYHFIPQTKRDGSQWQTSTPSKAFPPPPQSVSQCTKIDGTFNQEYRSHLFNMAEKHLSSPSASTSAQQWNKHTELVGEDLLQSFWRPFAWAAEATPGWTPIPQYWGSGLFEGLLMRLPKSYRDGILNCQGGTNAPLRLGLR